jgi:DNA-binding NarL/FixJ family response regulator
MPKRIAVLEAPEGALADLVSALRASASDQTEVDVPGSIAELVASHARQPFDLVLLDYLRGDGTRSGREALIALRAQDPELAAIAVADRGDVGLAAEAVKAGASDFWSAATSSTSAWRRCCASSVPRSSWSIGTARSASNIDCCTRRLPSATASSARRPRSARCSSGSRASRGSRGRC